MKFAQKRVFQSKTGKNEHHHWISHIQINLRTKFHFTQAILSFGATFAQKWYFWSKTEKYVHHH